MNKKCTKCGVSQPMDQFSVSKGIRASICKICHRFLSREHYKRNRGKYGERLRKRRQATREFVWLLKTGPCTDCGKTYHPVVMEFDHLGNKVASVSVMAQNGFSRETILEEIAKCELVCSNCHQVRTYSRKWAGRQTGKVASLRN